VFGSDVSRDCVADTDVAGSAVAEGVEDAHADKSMDIKMTE
jgi:hypothetical protein